MTADLSGTGKFRLILLGLETPPDGAGIEVRAGDKLYRVPFVVRRKYEEFERRSRFGGYHSCGMRYNLEAVLESGLEGVRDISEVELKFLPFV